MDTHSQLLLSKSIENLVLKENTHFLYYKICAWLVRTHGKNLPNKDVSVKWLQLDTQRYCKFGHASANLVTPSSWTFLHPWTFTFRRSLQFRAKWSNPSSCICIQPLAMKFCNFLHPSAKDLIPFPVIMSHQLISSN